MCSDKNVARRGGGWLARQEYSTHHEVGFCSPGFRLPAMWHGCASRLQLPLWDVSLEMERILCAAPRLTYGVRNLFVLYQVRGGCSHGSNHGISKWFFLEADFRRPIPSNQSLRSGRMNLEFFLYAILALAYGLPATAYLADKRSSYVSIFGFHLAKPFLLLGYLVLAAIPILDIAHSVDSEGRLHALANAIAGHDPASSPASPEIPTMRATIKLLDIGDRF
jgi:hypothetical protein